MSRKRATTAYNLKRALLAAVKGGYWSRFLADLSPLELEGLMTDWPVWARKEQLPPAGRWMTWLVMGGRGAGKTRAGAEWVHAMALGRAKAPAVGRIALIGETFADARSVMVEGVSGLLSVGRRAERPKFLPSRNRLEWPNGAVAQLFSAADPEALRGPQFGAAWSDEVGKWPDGEAVWDMLQFALRLGDRPRQMVTTTPRAVPLVKRLLADPKVVVTRMATRENAANLGGGFLDAVMDRYAGTRLGRQELDGELIEDAEDALFNRSVIEGSRVVAPPPMVRVVVAVDPPASSGARSAACGIVAAGLGEDGVCYVLADRTIAKATPTEWAGQAVGLYRSLEADALVAEVNQGGEMVATVVREADEGVPVKAVRASKGKRARAEPVALLYDQGRVRHVGVYAALEDQMCNFGPDGTSGGVSPDRIDALVWAVTTLMLEKEAGAPAPRVRRL